MDDVNDFHRVLAYLNKLRTWQVEFDKDNNKNVLRFVLKNKWCTKHFALYLADDDYEPQISFNPRPSWHYYYMDFEQPYVGCNRGSNFCTVFEGNWYQNEEDLLYRLKQLVNYRKG